MEIKTALRFLSSVFLLGIQILPLKAQYNEKYRPQFHFQSQERVDRRP